MEPRQRVRAHAGRYTEHFTLTTQHLALLQRMNVGWCGDEFGAPEIDPKRPYGNGDVLRDMLTILHPDTHPGVLEEDDSGYQPDTVAALERLHQETERALQIILVTQSFEPGEYVADAYSANWRRS